MALFKSTTFLIGLLALGTIVLGGIAVAEHTGMMRPTSQSAAVSAASTTRARATSTSATGTIGSVIKGTVGVLSGSIKGSVPHTSAGSSATLMAWLYPSKVVCSAQKEYSDGRAISYLKPEYFTVAYDGSLTLLTAAQKGCNGYSAANVASVRAHSAYQYVTVSSGIDSLQALTASDETQSAAIATLTKFAVDNQFTGVEIDFEDFASWDQGTYQDYVAFLNSLGDSLHAQGKKLMVDIPPISNATEQSYYLLTYSDMAKTQADFLVVMAYDYQFDQGAGTPIAPNSWVLGIIKNAKAAISTDRLVIGMPSYAYTGTKGAYNITRKTYDDIAKIPGIANATRDPNSGELMFSVGRTVYVFSDTQTLDAKRALIAGQGIKYISVWALGGNQWF